MTTLIREITYLLPEFRNIDLSRVCVSATFNRSSSRGGVLAYVLPLKYREGSPIKRKVRGKKAYHYAMLPLHREGTEILYIVYFMLPRFYNLTFREKLETIIHEIFHIHPQFNGDLRRFEGYLKCHGRSIKDYEKKVKELTDHFLETLHSPEAYEFLKYNFREASSRFGEVKATHIPEPRPRLIKVEDLLIRSRFSTPTPNFVPVPLVKEPTQPGTEVAPPSLHEKLSTPVPRAFPFWMPRFWFGKRDT